jgi:hypothetical protein
VDEDAGDDESTDVGRQHGFAARGRGEGAEREENDEQELDLRFAAPPSVWLTEVQDQIPTSDCSTGRSHQPAFDRQFEERASSRLVRG